MPLALPRGVCLHGAITLLVPLLTAVVPAAPPPSGHFNVGNTHSPELERLLPAVKPPVAGSALGVDVSSRQHDGGAVIDWTKVAAARYRFAFVKATEGSYYTNPFFASDVAGARAAGLTVAAYDFANPGYSSGTLQADFALDYAGQAGLAADGNTLPFIADLEFDPYASQDHTNECYGLTPKQMVAWIGAFTSEIYRRTGQHPVIYTIWDWWNTCTDSSTAFSADPLWVADYNGTPSPHLPAGWPTWAYWQYTSAVTVPGIAGKDDTDVSVLNPAALEVAAPASRSDAAGAAVSVPVRSLSAPTGPALSYRATGLPAGLGIDPATGVISGTLPATPGTFPVTVTVSGSGLSPVTDSFSWNVHGPVQLVTPPSQSGQAGGPVLLTVSAADSLPGCTLTFSATGLPPGLSIGPCGVISGWLGQPGTYDPVITASDSSGAALATVSFSWEVGQPSGRAPSGGVAVAGGGCLAASASKGTVTIEVAAKCRTVASQRWAVEPDGALSRGGDCLAVKGTAGQVTLRPCADTVFQDWQPGSSGELVNLSTGTCLAGKAGSPAELKSCDGGVAQRWTRPAGPLTSAIPGWCASAWSAAGLPTSPVSLRECAGSRATNWTAGPDGTLRGNGECLTLTFPAVNGALVTAAPCLGTAAQQWQPLPDGPVSEQLLNPRTGFCLADQGDQPGASQLSLGYCTVTDPGTSWRLS